MVISKKYGEMRTINSVLLLTCGVCLLVFLTFLLKLKFQFRIQNSIKIEIWN